jgi:hypothetical protein
VLLTTSFLWFQLKDGRAMPVRLQGLDPARQYVLHELNPAPGRVALAAESRSMSGSELMSAGIFPSCSKMLEAFVIELAP